MMYYLNRHGYPAVIKVGVSIFPMFSHAWVTLGDKVFVDTDLLADLHVMAEYPSWSESKRTDGYPQGLSTAQA